MIDRPLSLSGEAEHPLLPDRYLFLQAPFGERQRCFSLGLGFCLDQVGEALGFREVDPAVFKCSASELARPSLPQTFGTTQRCEQRVDDRTAAMG